MLDRKMIELIDLADTINQKDYKPSTLYYHRSMALLSILPHSKIKENFFEKRNGNFSIRVTANSDSGISYGVMPRLIFLYLYSYSYTHKTNLIPLGNSVYDFLTKLKITPSKSAYAMIRKQALALFNSTISFTERTNQYDKVNNFLVGEQTRLFWQNHNDKTVDLFKSYVRIGDGLFNEFKSLPIPANLDVISKIKNSAFQLDLFLWLNFRMYMIRQSKKSNSVFVSNSQLINQFGSNYSAVKDFKKRLRYNLCSIRSFWFGLDYEVTRTGLILNESPLIES